MLGAGSGHAGDGLAVPWMEFGQPWWLALIPLAWFMAWRIARGALGGWHGGKQVVILVARCVVLALLCVALAEPSVHRRATDVAVIVVRDMSDSVPVEQHRVAESFVEQSLGRKSREDRFGLVTAAREPFVQSLPTEGQSRTDVLHAGATDETNLEQAIQMARLLMPSDAGGRILLISDGNQTSGSIARATSAAIAARVPIDVATVEYDRSLMVRVQDVVVPAWTRESDAVNARIVIESGREATGRLHLMINGTAVDMDPDPRWQSTSVALRMGTNVFSVPLQLTSSSAHQIEAVFEPDQDARSAADGLDVPELLRATGVTFTSSRGRALVVSENAREVERLVQAIESSGLAVEVTSASMLPITFTELAGHDVVILANQPAWNFSTRQQEELVRYVRDAGGGLLMVGGPDSFGAGGWIGSRLAEVLPVELDPPQRRQMPMGALAVVVDRSGSMSAPVGGTNLNQQQIANEAAILGIRALSRLDQVAVVAFSDGAEVVVPLTQRGDPEAIARRIRTIGSNGGTNLFPAMEAAAAQLRDSPAGVKHLIILTDGQTVGETADGLAIAARLRSEGISISTVAIGDGSNSGLLQQIARVGGGRSYGVTSANSLAVLPQIFIKEAQTVRRALIWEGPAFVPRFGVSSEALRGMPARLPGVTGYVVTGERAGLSSVALRGPEGDPILAHWQQGLGRVTVYTSDATTRWNASWAAWDGYSAFWQQQVKWTMRPSGDPRAQLQISQRDGRALVTLELFDPQGERVDFARVRARVAGPQTGDSAGASEELTLTQIGPGRYQGEVPVTDSGVHIVSLRYDAASASGDGRIEGTVRGAIVRRGAEEMQRPTPAKQQLWSVAERTGGRIYKLDPSGADLWVREGLVMPSSSREIWQLIMILAVFAFLADTAIRRLNVDASNVKKMYLEMFAGSAVPARSSINTLTAAKAKASEVVKARSKAAATDRLASEARQTVEQRPAIMQDRPPTAGSSSRRTDGGAATPPPADAMSRLHAAKNRARGQP